MLGGISKQYWTAWLFLLTYDSHQVFSDFPLLFLEALRTIIWVLLLEQKLQ